MKMKATILSIIKLIFDYKNMKNGACKETEQRLETVFVIKIEWQNSMTNAFHIYCVYIFVEKYIIALRRRF